jgi:uncharacterized protein YbjQ (UPF0145 family)
MQGREPVDDSSDPMAGVPESGRERLELNKAGLFTSDLSINEYLLIEDAGYEPLGLVLGTSIYHIGYQRKQWRASHELEVLSQALYHARELAMQRMQEEAADLAADGIVGVRLNVKGFGAQSHTAEFVAIGTAVRRRDDPSPRPARPFTSDLTGQDFWTLLRTGAQPVGMVMGSCVYTIAGYGGTGRVGFRRNAEIPRYTQALYDARELAMTRMQREAAELAATGIVGVQLNEHRHGWDGRILEFFAIGTAITKDPDADRPPPPAPVIDFSR